MEATAGTDESHRDNPVACSVRWGVALALFEIGLALPNRFGQIDDAKWKALFLLFPIAAYGLVGLGLGLGLALGGKLVPALKRLLLWVPPLAARGFFRTRTSSWGWPVPPAIAQPLEGSGLSAMTDCAGKPDCSKLAEASEKESDLFPEIATSCEGRGMPFPIGIPIKPSTHRAYASTSLSTLVTLTSVHSRQASLLCDHV